VSLSRTAPTTISPKSSGVHSVAAIQLAFCSPNKRLDPREFASLILSTC